MAGTVQVRTIHGPVRKETDYRLLQTKYDLGYDLVETSLKAGYGYTRALAEVLSSVWMQDVNRT